MKPPAAMCTVPIRRIVPIDRLADLSWWRWHVAAFITVPLLIISLGWSRTVRGQENEATSPAVESEAAPPEVNLAQEVPVWVADLDGATAQSRREAEQKLLEAGPEALEYVPVILDHLSLDARERMERIEAQWRQMKTRVEVETTTVKMQDARTLGEALEAISLASGVEFDLESSGVAIDTTQVIRPPVAPMGFWQAVDLVLDQTDLDINFYAGDRERLALVPRAPERISRADSAAYAGIYRIEPTMVTARRVLGAPAQNALNLTMSISWQPNRTPIGLSIPIADVAGKLDNGVDLRPQTTGDQIDIATSSEIAESQFYLPMQLPRRRFEFNPGEDDKNNVKSDASEIKRLSGQVTALLPGKRRRFELLLEDVAPSQTYDAMTVAIEAIRESDPLHEIRVGIELFGAGRSLESHRQWIFENDVFVLLSDGTRKDHLGYQVFRQTGSGVGIGYLFDLGGSIPAGAQLIYESPTSVRQNEVPFVINGIPLP
ncbi:hypothetical protein [Aporhodopirellula aestuarii]|uniref:Uncharacterized protein n=1 Tax=Aporhodopirellula aestuarii TaxID=2950107 RepID=A0ABT0U8L6_9BACT|nr:hypothetical protein [Aporhodopirellula aestuarii]MCM2373265.1 hypothetical protein [Aporhodopirellula aestuarii]